MKKQYITTNHQEIKQWAQKYGGKPQVIDDPQALSDIPGVRIDFPGKIDDFLLSETKVRDVSWEEFFKKFEENQLAFIYIPEFNPENPKALYTSYKFIKRYMLHPNYKTKFDKLMEDFYREFIQYVPAPLTEEKNNKDEEEENYG